MKPQPHLGNNRTFFIRTPKENTRLGATCGTGEGRDGPQVAIRLCAVVFALMSAPAFAAISPALQSVLTNVGFGALAVGASILLIHAALFKIRLMRKEAAAFDKLPECSVCGSKPVADAKTGVCANCLDALDPSVDWTAEVLQSEEAIEECWRCGAAPVFPVGAMDWTCPSCAAPNPQPEGVVGASLPMSPEQFTEFNQEYEDINAARMGEMLADDPHAFDDESDALPMSPEEFTAYCEEAALIEADRMSEILADDPHAFDPDPTPAEIEERAVEEMWEKLGAHPDSDPLHR